VGGTGARCWPALSYEKSRRKMWGACLKKIFRREDWVLPERSVGNTYILQRGCRRRGHREKEETAGAESSREVWAKSYFEKARSGHDSGF